MSYSFGNNNRNLNGDDVEDYGVDQPIQEQCAPAPEPEHDGASYGSGRRGRGPGSGPGRVAGGGRSSSRAAAPPALRQSASRKSSRPSAGALRSSVRGSKVQNTNGGRVAGEDFTFLIEDLVVPKYAAHWDGW